MGVSHEMGHEQVGIDEQDYPLITNSLVIALFWSLFSIFCPFIIKSNIAFL